MDDEEPKAETVPIIMIVERRTKRSSDLSSADVVRILRKRAARGGRKNFTRDPKSGD